MGGHRRLVIVPHGPLAGLPFHVLPFDGGRGSADLAATHTVSYLPAAATTPVVDGLFRRVGRDATALVVGDPAYAPGRRLTALPGAGVEATAIGRLRGVGALVGADADRATVLDRISDAHVVHWQPTASSARARPTAPS